MKKNYEAPSIELIEIEVEDAILAMSDVTAGSSFGIWSDDDLL